MTPAPLHVLLLGWDAPAPTAPAASAAGPATGVAALAPRVQLTALLPHVPASLALAHGSQMVALDQLSAIDLEQLPAARVAPAAWPAAPYLGATPPEAPSAEAPNPAAVPAAASYATPVAPYVGRDITSTAVETGAAEVAATPETAGAPAAKPTEPAAQTTAAAPGPAVALALPPDSLLNRDAFEAESEPEADETAALGDAADAPEPELTPAAAPRAPIRHPQVLEVALDALRTQPADAAGLNFRVIQYARFATRLAATQAFAVIYAADWQAWLAGLEIRQLTGRPLVLHVHSLAQDRATLADRGWIGELERLALRRADLVLADTADLALRVLERYDLPPQRVRRLSRAATQDADQLADAILAALHEVAPGRKYA